MIYALVGFYVFRYEFEGTTSFVSLSESYVSMLTLITTANFPDVMLPSYHDNYFNMIFFISYLTIGLFFLLNLLLANVFNKFKGRLEKRVVSNEQKREEMVEKLYKKFDTRGRGFLNFEEFKIFVEFVFDLNLRQKKGKDHYKRLLTKIGKGEYENVQKDLIVEFVTTRGAAEINEEVESMEFIAEDTEPDHDQSGFSTFDEGNQSARFFDEN